MSTEWKNISENAKSALDALGEGFSPSERKSHKQIRGMAWDGDEMCVGYYNNDDLREIAHGLLEVAQWLEDNAKN